MSNTTMNKLASIFTGAIITAGLFGACGPTEEPSAQPCGDGDAREYQGESYCLYTQGIQETGFQCPEAYPHMQKFDGATACTSNMEPPEGFEMHVINEVLTPPANNTNQNNITQNNSTTMCAEVDCGDLLSPEQCPDGSTPPITCERAASGQCEWNIGECPAEVVCEDTDCGIAIDPDECPDGSTQSVTCEANDQGQCVWVAQECPATNNSQCEAFAPPIYPEQPNHGYVGVEYDMQMGVQQVSDPLNWGITSGTLPPGLSLDMQGGRIYGTPTTAGTYTFDVEASLAQSTSECALQPASATYTLQVNEELVCPEGEVVANYCVQCGMANGCDIGGKRCAKTCEVNEDCGEGFDGVCEQGVCWQFQCG